MRNPRIRRVARLRDCNYCSRIGYYVQIIGFVNYYLGPATLSRLEIINPKARYPIADKTLMEGEAMKCEICSKPGMRLCHVCYEWARRILSASPIAHFQHARQYAHFCIVQLRPVGLSSIR